MTKVYRVVVTREADSWLADVPGLAGTHTWAKNLPRLDQSVREAIALAEDLPEGAEPDLRLTYEYCTGDAQLDSAAAQLRGERARVEAEVATLAERTAELARVLVKTYSVRDVAAMLGVSPQRVSQLTGRGSAA